MRNAYHFYSKVANPSMEGYALEVLARQSEEPVHGEFLIATARAFLREA